MIIYGSACFGKTHKVSGVLWVKTRFLHVMFFPFVPRSSWVFVSKSAQKSLGLAPEPIQLPGIQWRSVFLAWMRASALVVSVVAALVGTIRYSTDMPPERLLLPFVYFAASVAFSIASYRLGRVTHEQLEKLLKDSEVPHALVKQAAAQLDAPANATSP